jgi:hypothetical protein
MDGSDGMSGSDKDGSQSGSAEAGGMKKSVTETGSKGMSGMDDDDDDLDEDAESQEDSQEEDEDLGDLPEEGEVREELIRAIADEFREYQTLQ